MSAGAQRAPVESTAEVFSKVQRLIVRDFIGSSTWRASCPRSFEMREIVRECFDLIFGQRIGDVAHDGLAAAGTDAGLEVGQRLEQILLSLVRDARNRL